MITITQGINPDPRTKLDRQITVLSIGISDQITITFEIALVDSKGVVKTEMTKPHLDRVSASKADYDALITLSPDPNKTIYENILDVAAYYVVNFVNNEKKYD